MPEYLYMYTYLSRFKLSGDAVSFPLICGFLSSEVKDYLRGNIHLVPLISCVMQCPSLRCKCLKET